MAEQVWFVTGASRGLGRSVVEEALAAGHRVAGTARRIDALAEFGRTYPGRFLALLKRMMHPSARPVGLLLPKTRPDPGSHKG